MTRDKLLYPAQGDIDFASVATRLSWLVLYNGEGEKPVSCAQHILITCDALADRAVAPWALLADGWRATLGDVEDFFFDAVLGLAKELSEEAQAVIRREWKALKRRHRDALHSAAGLPLPSTQVEAIINRAALTAAATERRDFLGAKAGNCGIFPPLRKVYRLRASTDTAADLLGRFNANLPALASHPSDFSCLPSGKKSSELALAKKAVQLERI